MFAKYQRLNSRDVLFLTKKKNYFSNGFFGFFYIDQYPNRKYNQISFHVSIKYNKHSTARNIIKRAVINKAQELVKKGVISKNQKIFVTLNKNKIPILQKEFEKASKKDTIAKTQNYFTQSFTALSRYLGKYSTGSSIVEKSS